MALHDAHMYRYIHHKAQCSKCKHNIINQTTPSLLLPPNQQFRKRAIVALPALRYLDRPVFEQERLAAEAWATVSQ
jgi:hypothetical protein